MAKRAKKAPQIPETITAKRNGRPENFSPGMVTQHSYADARTHGFAEFNGGAHLCVDVPNDSFTVSCRTSEGRRITFAFLPYRKGGAPQAVDIQYHDSPVLVEHSDTVLPAQSFIGFGPKRSDVRYSRHAAKPCTLLCVILSDACPNVTNAKGQREGDMISHTPGPWELSGDLIVGAPEPRPNPKVEPCPHNVAKLCWNFDGDRSPNGDLQWATAEANGNLIVAAPDLLRLLKALQPIFWNDGPLVKAYEHLEDEIDAVIARAEGRAT